MPPTVKKVQPKPAKRPAGPGVMSRIRPVEFEDEGIKICLYGRSGTGKTTLWSTFPTPILAVIASGKGELRSIPHSVRKQVEMVHLQSSIELQDVSEALASQNRYKTVVLDHVTGYQELVLKDILGRDELPAQLSWGIATQQQWGQLANIMKDRLRKLLRLSCNVVIVGQDRLMHDSEEDSEIIQPYINVAATPSVAGWLNYECDYTAYTFIRNQTEAQVTTVNGQSSTVYINTGKVEYCLRTGPNPNYYTKFRIPKQEGQKPPEVIVDPTYQKIMNLIDGKSATPMKPPLKKKGVR